MYRIADFLHGLFRLSVLWNCWRMPTTAVLATSSTVHPAAHLYLASPMDETNRSRQAAMGPAISAAMRTSKDMVMPGTMPAWAWRDLG